MRTTFRQLWQRDPVMQSRGQCFCQHCRFICLQLEISLIDLSTTSDNLGDLTKTGPSIMTHFLHGHPFTRRATKETKIVNRLPSFNLTLFCTLTLNLIWPLDWTILTSWLNMIKLAKIWLMWRIVIMMIYLCGEHKNRLIIFVSFWSANRLVGSEDFLFILFVWMMLQEDTQNCSEKLDY